MRTTLLAVIAFALAACSSGSPTAPKARPVGTLAECGAAEAATRAALGDPSSQSMWSPTVLQWIYNAPPNPYFYVFFDFTTTTCVVTTH